MPATARLPSGTRVEVLWGQPGQKVGTRSMANTRWPSRASLACRKASRCSMCSDVKKRPMRPAITLAIIAGVSSPAAGSSQSPWSTTMWPSAPVPRSSAHSPFSSNLPTTRGRTSSRQL